MCGIVGLAGNFNEELLSVVLKSIKHRGEDYSGMYVDEENMTFYPGTISEDWREFWVPWAVDTAHRFPLNVERERQASARDDEGWVIEGRNDGDYSQERW